MMIDISAVSLIIYDFDGVMTDNSVIVDQHGVESVRVNRSDGLAVSILRKARVPQVIISTETNSVVRARARKLGIPCVSGVEDKLSLVKRYCRGRGVKLTNVVYVGNDVNDLPAMRVVGFPVCPVDAWKEVRSVSCLVLRKKGGEGVVRELLGHIRGIAISGEK